MENALINNLINELKRIIDEDNPIWLPESGNRSSINLKSANYFYKIDVNRTGHKFVRFTIQLRENSHKSSVLMRLDAIGKSHDNPPGDYEYADQSIDCPHMHIASAEYGLSVAYPMDATIVNMTLTEEMITNMIDTLREFLARVNVANRDSYEYNCSVTLL